MMNGVYKPTNITGGHWGKHKIADWWLTYPSEKYEFVKWEDDIPN